MGRLRRRTRKPGVPHRSAGCLDRCPRHHRRIRPVDDLGPPRRAPEQRLRRDGDDVPAQGRRHLPVRARSLAQVPVADRAGRDVRLLVRLVERARHQRLRHRHAGAGRVVLGHDVHPGRGQLPVEPARLHRHRLHPRRLALQHLRRPAGGVAQLRHRGRADPARGGAHVPAIPHRRLVQRQHDLGDRRRRWARPGHDLAVLHGLVGLWVRDRGGVRPRIPQSRVRHPEGAAGLGRLLGRGLCPVAAGRGRNARHGGDRGRRDGHRLLQGRLRRARRERSGTGADRLPDRGAAAVDEHGHHGRLAGALRDRPRRDDDQVAGPAQQATACPASR